MDNFCILDFEIGDLQRILEIQKESFSDNWSEKMFIAESKNKFSNFKINKTGGITAGFIIYRLIEDEAEILNIVVAKEFRDKNFGKALLTHAIEDLKEKKTKTIFLEVNERNKTAIGLYNKTGFKQYGTRPNYYGADNAVLMKLIL
ncbi:MAG: ribosomal protein S18-alanine N-acetyltransferase [Endomicrobiaceae bacterium]|jgi:ribosomal-protein-alanine N-acetyltransferase|nr:ribosomal protein S18-alanine N-acetyltransferase [Endomicrobiaceae bacterium]MDD3729689.1 ribosomal protein S18-alanine N-acetyltransferase [Endomicrobiaceae bacterium]MDD4165789.1 ribosomal protein S18-alanine N-acetyltransferase [Endomicrobiaceae bacterium]